MKTGRLTFALAAFFSCHSAYSYLYSKTPHENKIKWNAKGAVNFYVNPSNSSESRLSRAKVMSATEDAVLEWNQASPVKLSVIETSNPPEFGQGASLRFSNNSAYFGAGVLAVTSVGYNYNTGEVYSGDIIMKDISPGEPEFSANPWEEDFIGDVLAHEIGHLLGLNHSETVNATMLFSSIKGQHSLHSDDVSGIEALYSTAAASGIKGTVVGQGFHPVFGAYVQAIDLSKNVVAAGVFTGEDGSFEIKGLDPDSSYALFMSPIRSKERLTEYYKTYRDDFCDGKSFQPSFYTACGGSSAGRAQIIRPGNNALTDIGYFTIRCSTGMDPAYLKQKFGSQEAYTALDYLDEGKTNSSFTGYFTETEITQATNGKGDLLKVDLSGLDTSYLGQVYLKTSLSFEKLGTAAGAMVMAQREDEASATVHTFADDPATLSPHLDFEFVKPLSSDSDQNVITLRIFPQELSQGDKNDVFAAPDIMTNDKAVYFASFQLMVVQNGEMIPFQTWDDAPYQDNSACLEGEPLETSVGYNPVSVELEQNEAPKSLSCATINSPGAGPGTGGTGSFFLGTALIFLIVALCPRKYDFFV